MMHSLSQRLQGGIFISSMMSWTTGAFVAAHGRGTCLVQLGALVADLLDRSHNPRFLLPVEQVDMIPVLAVEVEAVRSALGNTPVALNAAPGDLESARRMAAAFHEAGGDIFELNCHGGYGKLFERGLLRAMMRAENRPQMVAWLEALGELDIPIMVKFQGRAAEQDLDAALNDIAHIDRLLGVHVNVRSPNSQEPDLELVRHVRPLVNGLLLCSGHVTTKEHVTELLAAGADCVGVAQGVLDDPGLVARLGRT